MNYQKKAPQEIIEILQAQNVQHLEIDYYAWPQTFSDTTGPREGYGGGQAMTSFTVEAYVCDGAGPTVFVCCGMYNFINERFKPFNRINSWKKLPNPTL